MNRSTVFSKEKASLDETKKIPDSILEWYNEMIGPQMTEKIERAKGEDKTDNSVLDG